ncbi:MFS transporter [Calderihabitans maritimus]|uniref:Permeases of the major facilitator superfamily n=1 Tax=Calderihabitans maritimus TaxID=1246530 RepID=A0A1Z5HVX9_9FIRM|nr:MFS transporter [Calderihabitans maritimus]GAW93692.1 permeases of the major facilitator superfamily [Calderihabitans maritimus]
MRNNMKLPFAALCAVPFIMVLGNSMLIPLLPKMKSAMHINLFQVGLIITTFSVPAGLIIPLAGYLSDQYGRKIIITPALIIYGLGGILAGLAAAFLADPYYAILLGRIVQGIGAGGTYQLAMALTGDIFQTKERMKALGLLESSNGLGKVVSPVLGASLGLISWYAPFFAYGLLTFPIALGVWFLVKEPAASPQNSQDTVQYFNTIKLVFQQKGVSLLASFTAGAIVLFTLFGLLSYLSDVLEKSYNIQGITAGLLIAIPVTAMAFTSYVSGNYLEQKPARILKAVIVCGLIFVAVSMGGISLVANIYLFFFLVTISGIGTGLTLPAVNTLITSAAEKKQRGIITCLYGSTRFFGVALGPPAFGLVEKWGKIPLFLSAAILVLLATVLAWTVIREQELLPPQLQGQN